MAKAQKNQTYVMKLHTGYLKRHHWDLKLNLNEARKDIRTIVSLGDSQLLRWMVTDKDADAKATAAKEKIKELKRGPNTPENKKEIARQYEELYKLQFQPDLVMVVMDSKQDYDRALKGFSITIDDGTPIKYRRLLGTTGSIKKSTILFVNEERHADLEKRLNNGRDLTKKFVPAKLNAYKALACSGSIPVKEWPRLIVVKDCEVSASVKVVRVKDTDDNNGDPEVTHDLIETVINNASDGCGVMLPALAEKWAKEMDPMSEEPLSGVNTRCAFLKGMLFPFDFIEFAEQVAHTYVIKDAWGDDRDVRSADAIITVSMLKLWDSYKNYEEYYSACQENSYDFAIAKTAPHQLKERRALNYQYLQGYEMTDEQIDRLIYPTVSEIQECLGADWRKLLLYLCGENITEKNVKYLPPMVKSIMANPEIATDPYVNNQIVRMINKRIRLAKIGVLDVQGDFAIIGGDLYALMQSAFGLKVTGLLDKRECYHKYWIDKGVKDIVAFRSPMTSHNNITKMTVSYSEDAKYWFRYIKTCMILNAQDDTCMRENGSDFDSDTYMTTDNEVLLEAYRELPAIQCIQASASKCVPKEEDFIKSEKLGFGDSIGTVTNKATQMITYLSNFKPGTDEYNKLSDRIISMQNYQQNAIDRIKGVIARPVPSHWTSSRLCTPSEDADECEIARKELEKRIAADKKSYFFIYNYSTLKQDYDKYMKNVRSNAVKRFGKTLDELRNCPNLTEEESQFLFFTDKFNPVDMSPGTMNRICWTVENELSDVSASVNKAFDSSILRNTKPYLLEDYAKIAEKYVEYNSKVQLIIKKSTTNDVNDDDSDIEMIKIKDIFNEECHKICPDERVLSNIVVDVCYNTNKNKTFAWDICGEQIFKNVLDNNNHIIRFPVKDENGDIEYNGHKFKMIEMKYDGGDEQ